jgi:glycosyltransferase involved in cell wall biosynthesis
MMSSLSVIVPVYNRPDEVRELLESLTGQTSKNFEVIIVEDGSSLPCREVVQEFMNSLEVYYFTKPNSGPGMTRNYGVGKAKNDFFIFLDSDCILPGNYMEKLSEFILAHQVKCFGGPDKAHDSFTDIQKAISYSMTAFLTTGGIRGGGKKVIKFHPRSFNMGFSREVYNATQGFAPMRFGEDIDLSIRIEKSGYNCHLVEEAYVFHKRRTDFKKFFKQVYNSGIARINLYKRHPGSLKLTHFFPAVFLVGIFFSIAFALVFKNPLFLLVYIVYLGLLFVEASWTYKSLKLGIFSLVAALVQMAGYGSGFIYSFFKRVVFGKGEFSAFERNFYR